LCISVILRWQRAALDLADLNLVKEGSDLKKERAGRKSSFPLGLLTSGNLSPVDSKEHASIGAIVQYDRPIVLYGLSQQEI